MWRRRWGTDAIRALSQKPVIVSACTSFLSVSRAIERARRRALPLCASFVRCRFSRTRGASFVSCLSSPLICERFLDVPVQLWPHSRSYRSRRVSCVGSTQRWTLVNKWLGGFQASVGGSEEGCCAADVELMRNVAAPVLLGSAHADWTLDFCSLIHISCTTTNYEHNARQGCQTRGVRWDREAPGLELQGRSA